MKRILSNLLVGQKPAKRRIPRSGLSQIERLEQREVLSAIMGTEKLAEAARPQNRAAEVDRMELAKAEAYQEQKISAEVGVKMAKTKTPVVKPEIQVSKVKAEVAQTGSFKPIQQFKDASVAKPVIQDALDSEDILEHEVDADVQQQEVEAKLDEIFASDVMQDLDELLDDARAELIDMPLDLNVWGSIDRGPVQLVGDIDAAIGNMTPNLSLDGANSNGMEPVAVDSAGYELYDMGMGDYIVVGSDGEETFLITADGDLYMTFSDGDELITEDYTADEYVKKNWGYNRDKSKDGDKTSATPDKEEQPAKIEQSFGEKFSAEAAKAWNMFLDMFRVEEGSAKDAAGMPDPDNPDHGDPNSTDPWKNFTDMYLNMKIQAMKNSEVNPDPTADPSVPMGSVDPKISKSWVDGVDQSIITEAPAGIELPVDGAIDMGDDNLANTAEGKQSELPTHYGKDKTFDGNLSSKK